MLPVDSLFNQANAGEWEASQIVIPNFQAVGTNIEPYIRAVGGDDLSSDPTQFSLISAYANSRSVPQSPDPAVPAGLATGVENIYQQMFDVGDDDEFVVDNAVGKNNDLPYPQMDYPGGDTQLEALENHSLEFISATTIGGTTRIKGGNFPCGLIRIDVSNSSATTSNILIQLDLVPGNHRGYLCEPMTDM